MATQTKVIIHSDISGELIEEGTGETLEFSLDGTSYTIDLSTDEAKQFRHAFAPYLAAGRRTYGRPTVVYRPRPSKPDLGKIREWAEQHGYKVSPRGRISQSVLNAYDAAHV